ncbi:hypothetical protein [Prosthecobacter sp.]|uniref:hypothetical protein n=1 Tax=Prosthecobacter sp. TaxID=1965333 RepID=UPI0024898BCC|nr:hypothetical protein [Prosthecobacter sp.]MDI1311415.1 hypothetical protein [Prosthecobacter sp.]
MKNVPRFALLIWLSVAAGMLRAVDRAGELVEVGRHATTRSGVTLREKREVRVDAGTTKQETGTNAITVTTRYVQRVNLVRRLLNADSEELQVREYVKECVNFTGQPPSPNENRALLGKELRARKKGGHWDYNLHQGRSSAEEAQSLADLAFGADLLEILPLGIGTGMRRPGEHWKVEPASSGGKDRGFIILEELETTFISLEVKPDGSYATFTIEGKFHIERPMTLNARMEVSFTATIVRRLSDMLDVETKASGQFLASAQAAGPKREKIQLNYDYPFTLVRTQAVEGK